MRYRNDPDAWYDFGAFSARTGDLARADECFREVLALNQTHLAALLAGASLACVTGRPEEVPLVCRILFSISMQNIHYYC